MDMRKIKAMEKANKARILAVNPRVPEESGIYFLSREEGGIRYGYIGQAVDLLGRLAGHLNGYQHIDISLKKHGLFSESNPDGWKVQFIRVSPALLDEKEREYIVKMANEGYQLYNHTTGGQGKGKAAMGEQRPAKGYYDGLRQGYKNAQRFVARLFEKHLDYRIKSDRPNKIQEKEAEKFRAFLEMEAEDAKER